MVYKRVEEVDFTRASLPHLPMPQNVLFTSPEHFEVAYVINPHMEGHIGNINLELARSQWETLHATYKQLNLNTHVLSGAAGYPDMVFCANQTLPFYQNGNSNPGVVLSNMHAEQRKGEVPHIESFFSNRQYTVKSVANLASDFEGMGDAIWHPSRKLLWGGYGFRTDIEVYRKIATLLDVKILALELLDPEFYHLDTCFSVLDEHTVMIYPGAFTQEGLDLIHHFFDHVIECPEDESRKLFACNAHCPDQRHVVIQKGCKVTNALLKEAGFIPVEVDTSEYIKAGGSVFCMKQMFW